jgi:multidrug transporter EmrE-like cation transporter
MLENILIYKWLFLSAFFSALTAILIKQYEKNSNIWLIVAALASEICLIYGYVQLLSNKDVITQFSLVKVLSILIIILPSLLLFKSELTIKRMVGLLFAVISIYLLR